LLRFWPAAAAANVLLVMGRATEAPDVARVWRSCCSTAAVAEAAWELPEMLMPATACESSTVSGCVAEAPCVTDTHRCTETTTLNSTLC
jgi:hypothetical protein